MFCACFCESYTGVDGSSGTFVPVSYFVLMIVMSQAIVPPALMRRIFAFCAVDAHACFARASPC